MTTGQQLLYSEADAQLISWFEERAANLDIPYKAWEQMLSDFRAGCTIEIRHHASTTALNGHPHSPSPLDSGKPAPSGSGPSDPVNHWPDKP